MYAHLQMTFTLTSAMSSPVQHIYIQTAISTSDDGSAPACSVAAGKASTPAPTCMQCTRMQTYASVPLTTQVEAESKVEEVKHSKSRGRIDAQHRGYLFKMKQILESCYCVCSP
jgi:hypothetical protein